MVAGEFALITGGWYYFNEDGVAVKGAQTKGIFVTNEDGKRSYYDAKSGEKFVGDFFTTGDNHWYYTNENGQVVTGDQEINGQTLHFDENGVQTKGSFAADANGNEHYYDAKSGDRVDDSELTIAAKAEAYCTFYGFGI
ncbi:hypothetical protein [Streptococcus equinus]|uniref:hypothetical protein n=1 Tax=Streptococcus equinus TaxID=1335 RepID=UPI003077862B